MKEGPLKEPLINHWYDALSKAIGIEVVTSDFDSARQRLYAARREVQDSDLDQISLVASAFDPTKLWLMKNRKPPDEKA